MYDNIELLNRIKLNGKLKKGNMSIFGKSLSFVLNMAFICSLVLCILIYLLVNTGSINISSILNSVMNSTLLQVNIALCVALGYLAKINLRSKHSVAINVTPDDVIRIIFNDGKFMGMEYRIYMSEISNVCVYKDGTFSFYCANIGILKNNNTDYTKGIISIKNGDSDYFIQDLQDYLGKYVTYKNRRNR